MQKFLLDENLSKKLVDKLFVVFPGITHVAMEGLLNSFDTDIWKLCKKDSCIIITKDYDFYDMSHLFGCPPKVIKLSCGNKSTEYICGILSDKTEQINLFAVSDNCYMEIF